jgi:BED zinc finger
MDEDEILEQTDSTSIQTPTSAITSTQSQSRAWEEFEKLPLSHHEDGRLRARCIHCKKKEYLADSRTGTSNLRRHLDGCKKRPHDFSSGGPAKKIDQEVYHEKMAKCVLRHGRPFSWAEAEGDREVHSYLNEGARFICRNTMKSKCLILHEKHLRLLKSYLQSLPGKVCLTTDLWTSVTSEGYLCLTVHSIDKNWKLSSRVLNFRRVPPPHSAADLYEIIHKLLKEWGLERKVLSITMDNASNMDNLYIMLSTRLISSGKIFHIRCCAHVLNLIVQSGLKYISEAVKNVRDSVK